MLATHCYRFLGILVRYIHIYTTAVEQHMISKGKFILGKSFNMGMTFLRHLQKNHLCLPLKKNNIFHSSGLKLG